MANRERDPQREQFWRDVLRRFRASGLSVRAFCRQERLPEPRFYAWRRTIAERDGQSRRPRPQRPAFLPLVLRTGPSLPPATGMSLELRGGRVLHLSESMAAERVAALVHALEVSEDT